MATKIENLVLTASPTVPRPKIATVDPAWTSAVFHTAPTPAYDELINHLGVLSIN